MSESYNCSYECKWPLCGHKFSRIATKGWTNKDVNQSGGSNTITCPKCGNNLRTWKDAVTKKEIKHDLTREQRKTGKYY